MYFVGTAAQSDNVNWRNVSAVDWRRRRPECNSLPGTSVLRSADTGVPELRAHTALALGRRTSAVHHTAAVSDYGRTCRSAGGEKGCGVQHTL